MKNTIAKQAVHINTIGYFPNQEKKATIVGTIPSDNSYSIINTNGQTVYTGIVTPCSQHPNLTYTMHHADFSDFTVPGTYALHMGKNLRSQFFQIKEGIYNDSLRLCMTGFYGQRCGVPVTINHKDTIYTKKACHLADGFLDYYDPSQKGNQKDATGGWHDAGDYGKYTVNAAFATGLLLTAWEHYAEKLIELSLPIPESHENLPDFLAEIKFNLDWILKMQFPDGLVSHKVTRTSFAPMIMPSDDREKRFFAPWGHDATSSFAAVTAQAARVYQQFDPVYADTCLQAAGRALTALRNIPIGTKSDQSAFKTGKYSRMIHSDYLWALMEYRETTGDPAVEQLIMNNISLENFHVDVDWDWGLSKNLGIYTYLRSRRQHNSTIVNELHKDLQAAADRIVSNCNNHPFGRGLALCYWGCNGSIARTSLNLLMAYQITGKQKYYETALAQLSYLYGNNPYGRSFVTGDGYDPPRNVHHRPSVADKIEAPWPGHLVGGPHPAELDWKDIEEDAATNEIAINWDASLVYALAAFYNPDN